MSRKERFNKTYKENLFQGVDSISGKGSDLIQTQIIRKEIIELCNRLNVKIFVDAPCGDVYWMKEVWPKMSGIVQVYIGCDIVEELIEENKVNYEMEITIPKIWFEVLDIVTDPLPSCDLLFCRDCLVHLSFDSVHKFLRNFVESNCKYLLTTCFNREANYNYPDGMNWYAIDLRKEPFNLPHPKFLINEGCTEDNNNWQDKSLGLWTKEEIREACGI